MFRIVTINCNGLRQRLRRQQLFQWAKDNGVDVIFVQECYVTSIEDARQWEKEWGGKCFWSFGLFHSRGVGILLSKEIKSSKFFYDHEGRLVTVDIEINGQSFRLVNVYSPNCVRERKDFFDSIFPHLSCSNPVILGGDFNCVESTSLDKLGGIPYKGAGGADILKTFCNDFDLVDIYRKLHPNSRTYTFHRANVATRIDRFYIHSSLINNVVECTILPCSFSDHEYVLLNLDNFCHNVKIGPGFWKFNTSLLLDPLFSDSLTVLISVFVQSRPSISLEWWDQLKAEIKSLCISFGKKHRYKHRNEVKAIQRKYRDLQNEEMHDPGKYIDQINVLKKQLKDVVLNNLQGVKIRSKAKLLDNQEKPSKFFFKKEYTRAAKKLLTLIQSANGPVTSHSEIIEECRNFYIKLLSSEPIDEDICKDFLKDVPLLSEEESSLCDGPISKDEILTALRGMKDSKTPGNDGLCKEFYIHFFPILSDVLVDVINFAYDTFSLSQSQRLSYITLLCKDSTQSHNLKFWRPISLLNVDYKIISRVLANRLQKVLHIIIHPDQTCSIPGRSILDNVHLLRSISNYVDQKNLPVAFLSLDQEKAFDRVSHEFMFKALKSYGFGDSFVRWVRLLYTDIFSSVIVNGHISESFSVTRSVRQGCGLSPLLYVLCLEPFAIRIRKNDDIVGLHIPGCKENIKISLYADDATCICTTEKSIFHVLNVSYFFSLASGSKLNVNKTKGVWLGKWKSRSDHPFGISWPDQCKIVGVYFGKYNMSPTNFIPILKKFVDVLNLWQSRSLSLFGKSLVVNVLAVSKLIYTCSLITIPLYTLRSFEREVFAFLWKNRQFDPIQRTVTYLPPRLGGLSIIHLETKIEALRLFHLYKLINYSTAKWVHFAEYWIGLTLRKHRPDFFNNSMPHSDFLPSFYREALKSYHKFCHLYPDFDWHKPSTCKTFYKLLIPHVCSRPRAVALYPSINLKITWSSILHPFLDPCTRDIAWRISHDILPTNYLLFTRKVSPDMFCPLCGGKETVQHLLFQCRFSQSLWRIVFPWLRIISDTYLPISYKLIQFNILPDILKVEQLAMCLLLLFEGRLAIWISRNDVKFSNVVPSSNTAIMFLLSRLRTRIFADFQRLSRESFVKYWCQTAIFCELVNDRVKFLL